MAGWCELGTNAGAPCNINGDCAGGGSCLARQVFCRTSTGRAGLGGGCGRYQVCAGGSNAGRLCQGTGDCPGSTCPLLPASSTTAGSICLNASDQVTPAPGGLVTAPCLPAGSSVRVITQATSAGICP